MQKIVSTFLLAVLLSSPFQATAVLTENTHSTDLESGSSQFWSITDASQTGLDLAGTTLTISMWIRHESFYTSAGGGMNLMSKDNANNRQYTVTTRNDDASGEARKIRFSIFSSLTTNARDEYETSTQISVDTDYHVVFTFAGAGTGIIYLNGVSDYSQITSTFSGSVQDGTSRFEIGSGGWGGQTYFDGLIDDVRIWNRTLTEAEVEELYADPCNFDNGANLISHWLFDDDLGVDQEASNNDLTNNNSATFVTTPLFECAVPAEPETVSPSFNVGGALYINGSLYVN